ncbi:MAG: hypothetical protein ACE5JD_15370 [Candidatus Methylomirabilia bacterium]
MHRLVRLVVLVGLAAVATPPDVWPHRGGLDAYGCDHDRKRGSCRTEKVRYISVNTPQTHHG